MLFPNCVESDRGHGRLLTNSMRMMCRRSHRNARWRAAARHRKNVNAGRGETALVQSGTLFSRNLCRSYTWALDVASISYTPIRIFDPMARRRGVRGWLSISLATTYTAALLSWATTDAWC